MTELMEPMTYQTHPAADIFPMMDEASFQELKADIAANGLSESGMLLDGKILDGRNRYRACQELGIEMTFAEVEPHDVATFDPLQFVLSKNLHRRHLSTSQRAAVAGKLATLKHGDNQHTKEDGQICTSSIDDAAKVLKVSPRSVKSARKVQERGSVEVNAALEQGQLPVSVAAEFVASVPDKAKQAAIVADGPKAVRVEVRKRLTKKQADEKRKGMNGDGEKPVCSSVASASESTPRVPWKSLLNVKRAFLSTRIKADDDYRMNTLKRLILGLAPNEKIIVMDWLTGCFETPTISKGGEQ